MNPHQYPVGLEEKLFGLKTDLILKARSGRKSQPVAYAEGAEPRT
jgi:hypothetical protein